MLENDYMGVPEFKRRFPGAPMTVERWLKNYPERLPKPFWWLGRRYFHRQEAEAYLVSALPTFNPAEGDANGRS